MLSTQSVGAKFMPKNRFHPTARHAASGLAPERHRSGPQQTPHPHPARRRSMAGYAGATSAGAVAGVRV
jgi:hypothetical protein